MFSKFTSGRLNCSPLILKCADQWSGCADIKFIVLTRDFPIEPYSLFHGHIVVFRPVKEYCNRQNCRAITPQWKYRPFRPPPNRSGVVSNISNNMFTYLNSGDGTQSDNTELLL